MDDTESSLMLATMSCKNSNVVRPGSVERTDGIIDGASTTETQRREEIAALFNIISVSRSQAIEEVLPPHYISPHSRGEKLGAQNYTTGNSPVDCSSEVLVLLLTTSLRF